MANSKSRISKSNITNAATVGASKNSVQAMIQGAQASGLSQAAIDVLCDNLNGPTVAGANGAAVGTFDNDAGFVTLFVRIIDMTGSLLKHRDTVIDEANKQIVALEKSKHSDILMSTWFFDTTSTLLHSYLTLDKVVKLDRSNYNPDNQTAFFDAIIDAATSAVAYAETLRDAGYTVKIVFVAITDGDDNASSHSIQDTYDVVTGMLAQEIYTFALCAFGANGEAIAKQIGIPDENVYTAGRTDHDIRLALGTVSASVVKASQTLVGSGSFFS